MPVCQQGLAGKLSDMDRLGRFDVAGAVERGPHHKGQFGIWQYTSEGSVPGIGGRVDLDETTGYRDYKGTYRAVLQAGGKRYPCGRYSACDGRLYASSDGSGAGKTVNGTYSVDRVLPGKACPILIGERPGLGTDGGLHRRAGGDSHPQRDAVRARRGNCFLPRGRAWLPGCAPLACM